MRIHGHLGSAMVKTIRGVPSHFLIGQRILLYTDYGPNMRQMDTHPHVRVNHLMPLFRNK